MTSAASHPREWKIRRIRTVHLLVARAWRYRTFHFEPVARTIVAGAVPE
jgi:hypothetical protein